MGLFFERTAEQSPLTDLLRQAIQQPPPNNHGSSAAQAAEIAGTFPPLVHALTTALDANPPQTPAETAAAGKQAAAVTNQLLGGTTFNTGRFLVATAIFLALLIAAVVTDATNLKNSPTALYALATTVFGIVVGFLGSEKSA